MLSSENGEITGVRGDWMVCSTGELYTKLPSQPLISLCTPTLLLLLWGSCYRLSAVGSNWCKVSVQLAAVTP